MIIIWFDIQLLKYIILIILKTVPPIISIYYLTKCSPLSFQEGYTSVQVQQHV